MTKQLLWVCLSACLLNLISSCKEDHALENPSPTTHQTTIGTSPNVLHRCNTDQKMQQLLRDHQNYREQIQIGRARTMEKLSARSNVMNELYTVPLHIIIVHRPFDVIGRGSNISEARIRSQIEALNQDFLRQNRDAVNTPNIFPAAGAQVQFCLAKTDPRGNATNGISRYPTSQDFDANEIAIKSETSWNPKRYLNVWVAPDIDGLGYAYLPSTSDLPDPDEDGVVVLTEAFGGPNSGAEAPFDLGRTLTHEVGHYLGLDHIWGEGCNIDDGISDTPDQADYNEGCPRHPSPSCNNSGDMFMNYMDYTDDDCLNAFTHGQVVYMRRILETSRADLVQPGLTECSSILEVPTCSDGLQNGDETGIDCGGSDCPPCSTTTASDLGILSASFLDSEACGAPAKIAVTVQNFGTGLSKPFRLQLGLEDRVTDAIEWTASIAPGSTKIFHLEGPPARAFSQALKIVIVPAGSDTNTDNNRYQLQLPPNQNTSLTLTIQPDEYGSEISWRIRDHDGNLVAKGDGYEDFDMTTIQTSLCLPDGCYRLIFRDAFGDGICCDYGAGWYKLTDAYGEELVYSDGYYGYRETTWFCMEGQAYRHQKIEREPRNSQVKKSKPVRDKVTLRPN